MIDPINNASALDPKLIKHRESSRLNYDDVDVIQMFKDNGCEVHSIEREIVETEKRRRVYKVVFYTASCGHESKIRFSKFLKGQGRVRAKCCRPRGEKHFAYNPNLTDEERLKNRDVWGNIVWRTKVFKRDKYTCQNCGDNRGGNLEAHHLNSYSDFIDQRFDIDNGVTLCESCHKAFHKEYSFHHNTKEQFIEWMKQDNTEVSLSVTA